MVIVQLSGGLGNQMFEYALYLRLKAEGKTVKIDDTTCYGQEGNRPRQLGQVFGISYDRASEKEIIRMTDSSMKPLIRLRRKIFGRKSLAYREKDTNFDPKAVNSDPIFLEGCFQSEKYFAPVKEQVREAYRFQKDKLGLGEKTLKYLEEIESSASVSIHVRRGDYLDSGHGGIYTGICTLEYYQKAMEEIKKRVPDARFFVFTNDYPWAKEHFEQEDCCVVEGSSEDTGYQDMYLMSRCRHNIIANSSFSWWGAWLNDNPEKCVIAPKRWLNGQECRDIYTEDMIRL